MANSLVIQQTNKVQAFFKFSVYKAESNLLVKETGLIPNLVLDSGLNRWGTASMDYCYVGTGTSTPNVNQTGLDSVAGKTSTRIVENAGSSQVAPYYLWYSQVFRFSPGQVTGNLTEAGIGFNPDNSLFNRVLITDSNGNPTALTVLADEYLDVTVELRVYQDLTDRTSNINLGDGVTRTVLARASRITATNISWELRYAVTLFTAAVGNYGVDLWNGPIGSLTQTPNGNQITGSYSSGNAAFQNPYVNNSLKQTGYLVVGLNNANGVNLQSVNLCTSIGNYQFQFDPPITKTSDQTLQLNLEVSWDRYVS